MTQELNIQNYDLKSIQKLFSQSCDQNNFLNQYTLLDVEEGKKKVYMALMKKYNYQHEEYIQQFVDATAHQMTDALFLNNRGEARNTQMVGVKNVIHDPRKLNPQYFQETYRIINIDSMYRTNTAITGTYNSKASTNMMVDLNDELDDVIALELTNVCVPYTFYSIDAAYGNNYFYLQKGTNVDISKVEIPGGNYNATTLVDAVNSVVGDLSISLDPVTNKVKIENQSDTSHTFIFYDYLDSGAQDFSDTYDSASSALTQSKINNNLGWIMGFRNVDSSNVTLEYTVQPSETVESEALCFVPQTKYFIIVIDDMNKNQTNKGLVQISHHDKEFIRPTHYFKNIDNSLNCLTNANFGEQCKNGRPLTKNQMYSALQINNYRTNSNMNKKNSNLNTNLINNVFGIVPFENKSLEWGRSMFTSDKNKFKRKYGGPVNIKKLQIKLLDDRGNVINLNGAEWSFSMISTHLYQS